MDDNLTRLDSLLEKMNNDPSVNAAEITIEELKNTISDLTERLAALENISVKRPLSENEQEELKKKFELEMQKRIKDAVSIRLSDAAIKKIFNDEISELEQKTLSKHNKDLTEYKSAEYNYLLTNEENRSELLKMESEKSDYTITSYVKSCFKLYNISVVDLISNDYIKLGIEFKILLDAKKDNILAESAWKNFAVCLALESDNIESNFND